MRWRARCSTGRPGRLGLTAPIALSLGVATSLGACSSHTTTVATPNGTAKISSSNNGKNSSIKVKSTKGSAEINSGPELPSGFPKDVPLPSRATLTASYGVTSKGKSAFQLSYRLEESLTAGLKSYDAKLKAAGFTLKVSSSSSGSTLQNWSSSTWDVLLTAQSSASSSSSKPTLSVEVTPKTSTTTS